MIDIAITSVQHSTVIISCLTIWFICMLCVSLCLTDHLNVTFMVSSLVFTLTFAGAASAYIVEGIFPPYMADGDSCNLIHRYGIDSRVRVSYSSY